MLPSEEADAPPKRRTLFSKGIASCSVVMTVFILFLICSFYFYADLLNPSRVVFGRWNGTLAHVRNVFTSNPLTSRLWQQQTLRPTFQPVVLLWTTYFSETGTWLPQPSTFHCPFSECIITDNRSHVNISSAVVFHWRNVDVQDLPKWRHASQRWVLFNMEAPTHTPSHILDFMSWKVNWTATYRRDSDIHTPYGYMKERIRPGSVPKPNSRRKPVCWLVSNCRTSSKRETYVEQMKKFIAVDVYGQCGPHKCNPSLSRLECYKELSTKYKFYLSFENSICKDYATEKLYNALLSDMVPVVMGGENYVDILPPFSYIDALSFDGPEELAKYLLFLHKNEDKYMGYMMWKKYFEVVDGSYRWVCDLCKKLHGNETSTHDNLSKWWYEDAKCSSWVELTNSIFT